MIIGCQKGLPAPLRLVNHSRNLNSESQPQTVLQVQTKIPKDKGVIIGCQKGLRSLAAAEQLSRAGYGRVAWINGGFDTARPADLRTSNNKDVRCVCLGRGQMGGGRGGGAEGGGAWLHGF